MRSDSLADGSTVAAATGPGRARRRRDLARSLTLLHAFLLASAAILIAGGTLLGWTLTRTLHQQALDSERWALARYVDGVVRPKLVRDDRVVVTREGGKALRESLAAQPDVAAVKVWRPDGRLAWASLDQSRIGKRFPLDGPLETTLRDGRPSASFVSTAKEGEEDDAEVGLGFPSLLQLYAPIMSSKSHRVIGAYEIYADPSSVDRLIGSRRRMIWIALGVVFLGLWAALALLVRQASRLLHRQNAKLRARTARLAETNRLLEQSALEAVESLNATVDAKDPYTAGHSQRVQRIALALAEELGLERERREVVRFAGLFHDIGKIGVPDAILTKPGKLSEPEFEVVKRHPEDGARIVARLHQLREAVPAVLHHHERWDGKGYPEGLAENQIPLEAAIVGLADAFDAMTTDRPYSDARPLRDAADEIVRCRGSQFAPAVVDAFLRVLDRTPGLLEPFDAPEPAFV
jgi:putative nucleotidyltransferase with HDIG domain